MWVVQPTSLARDPGSCYLTFAEMGIDQAQGFLWEKDYSPAIVIKSECHKIVVVIKE